MKKYCYSNESYIKNTIRKNVERIIAYYVDANRFTTIECRIAIVRDSNHIFGELIKKNTTINSIISAIRNIVTYVYQALTSPANKETIRAMENQGLLENNSNGIRINIFEK